MAARSRPIRKQCFSAQSNPSSDDQHYGRRQFATQHPSILDCNQGLITLVDDVNMWRIVVAMIHRNRNSKKVGNRRQLSILWPPFGLPVKPGNDEMARDAE